MVSRLGFIKENRTFSAVIDDTGHILDTTRLVEPIAVSGAHMSHGATIATGPIAPMTIPFSPTTARDAHAVRRISVTDRRFLGGDTPLSLRTGQLNGLPFVWAVTLKEICRTRNQRAMGRVA